MSLNVNKREEIYNYLDNSPVMGMININKQNYMLVHSIPFFQNSIINANKNLLPGKIQVIRYNDYKQQPDILKHTLWKRDADEENLEHNSYELYRDRGFITICGHSPDTIASDYKDKGFIRIDSGCGHAKGKLTCLMISEGQPIRKKNLRL